MKKPTASKAKPKAPAKAPMGGNGVAVPKSKIAPAINANGTTGPATKKKAPTTGKAGGKKVGGVKAGSVGKKK